MKTFIFASYLKFIYFCFALFLFGTVLSNYGGMEKSNKNGPMPKMYTSIIWDEVKSAVKNRATLYSGNNSGSLSRQIDFYHLGSRW